MEGLYREKNGQLSFVKPDPNEGRALYKYKGPVFKYDQYVGTVTLETWANSPAKAYSNMIFQVKKKLGHPPDSPVRIHISKNLIVKEDLKYGKSY